MYFQHPLPSNVHSYLGNILILVTSPPDGHPGSELSRFFWKLVDLFFIHLLSSLLHTKYFSLNLRRKARLVERQDLCFAVFAWWSFTAVNILFLTNQKGMSKPPHISEVFPSCKIQGNVHHHFFMIDQQDMVFVWDYFCQPGTVESAEEIRTTVYTIVDR